MSSQAPVETTTLRGPRPLGKIYVAALLLAGLFYGLCVAPGPLWQDSGMAQNRTLEGDFYGWLGLALSHPLYYVFTTVFQYLPFTESAYKTNLVSAVFGAVTVANVHVLLQLLTRGTWAALAGTVSVAVAHTFWQHCALAEVYTLSTALLTGELLCLVAFHRTARPGYIVLLFFLNGLGVSNHLLALLSLACYLPIAAWLVWRARISWKALALAGALWLLGAGLYIGLIIGEIASGQPPARVLHAALFGIYRENVLNLVPGLRELRDSVLYLGLNFPTPAVLLAVPGILAIWRRRTLPLVGLALLLAVHLVWAIRYDVPDQYTFFIPAVLLIGVGIGLGTDVVLAKSDTAWRRGLVLIGCALPALVYIPLPALLRRSAIDLGVTRTIPFRDEYDYFLHPWKTGYHGARLFGERLQEVLPAGAVLLADDTTVRPVHYFQLTGRWRRDDLAVYPSLTRQHEADKAGFVRRLQSAAARGALYIVTPAAPYAPEWMLDAYQFEPFDVVYRVLPRENPVPGVSSSPHAAG